MDIIDEIRKVKSELTYSLFTFLIVLYPSVKCEKLIS